MKIKKSLFLSFLKSLNGEKDNFELLKNEVLAILTKQAKKEKHDVMKAIADMEIQTSYITKSLNGNFIVKSGYPVGTIREWKGKKYIKVAPKMWKRKYDKNDRGASISAGKLIKQVEKCENVEQLMQLVLANKQRFSDENGKPLPIVDKIRASVDKKNESFDKQTQTEKHTNRSEGMKGNQNAKKDGVSEEEITDENIAEKGKSKLTNFLDKNGITNYKLKFAKNKTEIWVYPKVAYDGTSSHGVLITADSLNEIDEEKDFYKEMIATSIMKPDERRKLLETKDSDSQAEAYANRSQAMMGNQNAKKDSVFNPDKVKMVKKLNGELYSTYMTDTNIFAIYFDKETGKETGIAMTQDIADIINSHNEPSVLDWKDAIATDIRKKYPNIDRSYITANIGAIRMGYRNGKKVNVMIMKNNQKDDSQSTKSTSTLSDVRKKYESSKSVQGNKKTVTLPNGEKIKCHYKLVEADAPTATHDEKTFAPVEALTKNGQTINDRDYSHDKDAQDSVINIASKYGGQALSNPPIVTKDGVVVSGNNRTMSSKLAAKNGTDKAYLEDLKEQIDEFGIDEDELKNFKHPRIILEMDNEHEGEYTTQEMAKFNESGMKTQNTVEKAVKISKTLGNSNISSISESISEYSTLGELYNDKKGVANFISKLIDNGVLTSQNKMEYVNSDNTLSDAGKEFVETVLVGTVLNENNIRSMNSEGGKKLRKKLIRALMPLAQNKGEGNEYSISNELNDAVKIALEVSHNPDKYKTVSDYTDSQDMFDENAHKTDEVTAKFADLILNHGEKEFADKMKSLQAGLHEGASGQMDMFLGDCESKDDVMRRVLEVKKAVQKAIQNLMRFKMAV